MDELPDSARLGETNVVLVGGWRRPGTVTLQLLGEVGASWRYIATARASDHLAVPVAGVVADAGLAVGPLSIGPRLGATVDVVPVTVRVGDTPVLDLSPLRVEAGLVVGARVPKKP
ncbi:MAG: hypothetical protein ACOZNI_25435 [Myxococcota bacterium]